MRKPLLLSSICLLCLFVIISFKNYQTGKFYYAFGRKKPLTAHATKLAIRFGGQQGQAILQSRLASLAVGKEHQKWHDGRTVVIDAANAAQQQGLLERFNADKEVVAAGPVYLVDQQLEAVLTDEFMVQFTDGISETRIDSLNKANNVSIIRHSLYYLLRVSPKTDVLEMANAYYETGLTVFSHPNFLMPVQLFQHIPNDTYFSSQFNFHNIGQIINTIDNHVGTSGADIKAPEAWNTTRGSASITVAVLDEGVTSDHPDLPNTRQVRLAGSNFAGGTSNDPSPHGTLDNHGNGCAGLIGATMDNNMGITGLAPQCRIMPIKITDDNELFVSNDVLASAIKFAADNNADVLSNSWGMNTSDTGAVPSIVSAIRYAVTNGRGGKGAVVVFAAGNTAAHSGGHSGYISFPSNVNVPGVLTVGASDRNDSQADYSPTSNPSAAGQNQYIDVVAPSHKAYPPAAYPVGYGGGIAGETFEVWSLDMPGATVGYNAWPNVAPENQEVPGGQVLPSTGTNFDAFTGRFGGTSAACPQVAGLAALILSMNPNLTAQQVFSIITNTTDKTGGYVYNTAGFSNELGYGRINACKAVNQVLTTSGISGPSCYTTGTVYTFSIPNVISTVNWSISPNLTILSGQGTSTIQVQATSSPNQPASVNATIPSACGNNVVLTKYIGLPILSGGYTNAFDGSQNPLGYYPGVTNPACTGYYITTNIQAINTSSVTWSKVSSSGVVNYTQTGNNISFYLFSPGEWVIFQLVIANGCGSYTYQFKWLASNCGSGGQPCNSAAFTITPNPASSNVSVTPNILPPCDLSSTPSSGTVTEDVFDSLSGIVPAQVKPASAAAPTGQNRTLKLIRALRMYDVAGKLLKSMDFGTGVTQLPSVDVSSLRPGIYFIEITDNKAVQRSQLLITR